MLVEPGPLHLERGSSVVVLAPHCDDETLGAAGLAMMIAAQGNPVRIVMMTNGDGFNRYALGAQHKRLRPRPEQFVQFAYRRQEETLEAVQRMGLSREDVIFLGYPDRGLAAMWDEHWDPAHLYRSRFTLLDRSPYPNSFTPGAPFCGRSVVDDLKAIFRQVRPTHVITSHPHDAHSDHWATYCFACYALEELIREGADFAAQVQVLGYLTHRGLWPRPRGYHPLLPMDPPRLYHRLPFPWVSLELPPEVVHQKYWALMAYQSQLRFMRNYLLSFVRRSELFGVFTPLAVPRCSDGRQGLAKAGEMGLEGLLWTGPHCEVLDPVPSTWAGRVRRGGELRSVLAVCDDHFLHLRLNLGGKPSRQATYLITLQGVAAEGGKAQRARLQISIQVPDRLAVQADGPWSHGPGVARCRTHGRQLDVAVALEALGRPERVFLGVESRFGRLVLDRMAWEMLDLTGSAGDVLPGFLSSSRLA